VVNPLSLLLAAVLLQGPGNQPVAGAQGPDYLLGPDDVITVTTVGLPQFSGDFLVSQSGYVTLPIVGLENVTGKTLSQLTSILMTGFKKRLKNPEVTVNLKTARIDRASVLGDVKLPGVYPVRPGFRLLDMLSASGGLIPGAVPSDYMVNIVRGTERKSVALKDVLLGDPNANVPILPSDTISLSSDSLVPVNVIGTVKTPGLYRLRSDMNGVLEALAQAGGTLDGAALSHVTLRHLSGQEQILDLSKPLLSGIAIDLPRLQAGDLIIVPQSQNRFAVLGAVDAPGIFPLLEGHSLSLVDAVAQAKGSDAKESRFRYIGIIRNEDGKSVKKVYDLGKFLKFADATQNPDIHPGDVIYVPVSNRIKPEELLRDLAPLAVFATLFR